MLNSHNVTINRYCGSIVATSGIVNKKKTAGRKKKSACCCSSCTFAGYNKKGPRTIKKLTELINLMYETRYTKSKDTKFYWVTITTCQHKTGKTDSELYYSFKLWQQHRKDQRYIATVERQRETGDLHFHLVVEQPKKYNLQAEVKRLAALLGTDAHPALFEAKYIHNLPTLVGYIGKYIRKPVPKMATLRHQRQN